MSEATDMQLVYEEIASFLGMPQADWSPRDANDVSSAVRKGIDAVVHNEVGHQFSWMRPVHRFRTADGQRRYTLPLDFEQFQDHIYFDGENYQYPPITQLPATRLYQLETEYNNTSVPIEYALEVVAHDGATQQHKQLVLHPTPDAEYDLIGPYIVGPIRSLTTARPWFPGGPENRELFVESCLAQVESKFMDGPQTDRRDRFQSVLMGAIARDHRRLPRNLGQMGMRGRRGRDWYRWKLGTLYNSATDL